jgi:hypothetical protein
MHAILDFALTRVDIRFAHVARPGSGVPGSARHMLL